MSPRARRVLAQVGRAAALCGAAVVLAATTVPTCEREETVTYQASTTCGPAGTVTLSFTSGERSGCGGCMAYVDATGANAVGLPEQGEIDALYSGPEASTFDEGDLALVGSVPIDGSVPPVTVQRECRFEKVSEGVLRVQCHGEAPEAACSGTLTRIPAAGT